MSFFGVFFLNSELIIKLDFHGNKQRCLGCVVQPNWDCINLPGFPYKFSLKVVIPNCGNGVFGQERGKPAMTQNLANGDGCDYFCKVEPDWICIDGKNA